jgi:transposase
MEKFTRSISTLENSILSFSLMEEGKQSTKYCVISRLKKPDISRKVGWEIWKEQYGYVVGLNKKVRWVMERTFAWLQKYRRLNKNYKRIIQSFETMTHSRC